MLCLLTKALFFTILRSDLSFSKWYKKYLNMFKQRSGIILNLAKTFAQYQNNIIKMNTWLLWYNTATCHFTMANKKQSMKVVPYALTQQSNNQTNIFWLQKYLLSFFKISKNVQHCIFFLFFAKSCVNIINHNNINMNDIQNSNNYSHWITLSISILSTLPCVWPFFVAA